MTDLEQSDKQKPMGYWETRGWTVAEVKGYKLYSGLYAVGPQDNRREFVGHISVTKRPEMKIGNDVVMPEKSEVDVYIVSPPVEIRTHPEGRCFQLVLPDKKLFKVHYNSPPTNVDDAIAHIEKVLSESLFPATQK